MTLCKIEHDFSLTALVAGGVKIKLTSLNTWDANSIWEAFNDEITFIVSFISTFLTPAMGQSFQQGL